jgi:hypothetical protein
MKQLENTTRTQCLITGCTLYLQQSRGIAWGDLHMQGDRFVFNGCVDRNGRMDWRHLQQTDGARTLTIPVGEDYFERRGVLVCRASLSLLNVVAVAYVAGSPHCPEIPA